MRQESLRFFNNTVIAVLVALKLDGILDWSWAWLLIYTNLSSIVVSLLDVVIPALERAARRWLLRRRLRRHF